MKSEERDRSVSEVIRANFGFGGYLGRLDGLLGDGADNGNGAAPDEVEASLEADRSDPDPEPRVDPDAEADFDLDDVVWEDLDAAEFGLDEPDPEPSVPEVDDVVPRLREALLDALFGDVHNVLLYGPADSPTDCEVCAHLLSDAYDDRGPRLIVTSDHSPAERLSILETYGHLSVEEMVIIALGDRGRLTAEESGAEGDRGFGVEQVRDATDLSRLGLVLNKHLVAEEDERPLTLCFHHFSDVIADNDLERVFRFLHILHNRIESVGGRAHYHVDPATIGREQLATLARLFDVVIEFDEAGDLRVEL